MPRITSLQTLSTRLASSLLVLGLAACGASSDALGESEQPFSANDGNADDTDEANAESADANAACDEGVAPSEAPAGFCQITARGLCFDDGQAACACAGCNSDACAIAESFPAQAFCPSDGDGGEPTPDPDAPVSSEPGQTEPSAPTEPAACPGGIPREPGTPACDFVVGGLCFDDGDAACACAGCASERCMILESYPAQVSCQ